MLFEQVCNSSDPNQSSLCRDKQGEGSFSLCVSTCLDLDFCISHNASHHPELIAYVMAICFQVIVAFVCWYSVAMVLRGALG